MQGETELAKLKRRYKASASVRDQWDSVYYKEIRDNIIPKRGQFTGDGGNVQDAKNNRTKIVDITAQLALQALVAGMQSGLTSPSTKWFRLFIKDNSALTEWGPVKLWLSEVETIMYSAFNSSNFYQVVPVIYSELGAFGTACQIQVEHPIRGFHFIPCTAGTYCLTINDLGEVNGMFRNFWMSAENIVEKFGEDSVSQSIENANKENPDTMFEVIQAILENPDYDETKVDNQAMRYKSTYWEAKGESKNPDEPLEVSGFEEFPAQAPRWNVRTTASIYGESVGMDALPTVKMLQQVEKATVRATHLMVDPPLSYPSGLKGVLSLAPGSRNPYNPLSANDAGIKPTLDINYDLNAALATREDFRALIRKAFYNDLWLMDLEGPAMTATEVIKRQQERLLVLGPMVERVIHEYLSPIIDRSFYIMSRSGALPPPPQELFEQEIDVEFMSLLAQAQKVTALGGIESLVGFVGGLASLSPSALDNLDIDQSVLAAANAIGVPPKIINPPEQVKQIREQKQAQMAEMKAQEEEMQQAQVAKTLADSKTGEPNVLTDMAAQAEA